MTIHPAHAVPAPATDRARAVAVRDEAVHQRLHVIAQNEQRLLDAEVRDTRRALVSAVRRRGGTDAVAFCDDDFLAVADRPALYQAILDAAVTAGRADNADLQLYDRHRGVLRLVAHHGFPQRFLTFFATVDAATPSACAVALATRQPVVIDDIARHEIFAGRTTLEPVLDAGSRAVSSHPLIAGDRLLGVLSFHHRRTAPSPGHASLVASCATQALTRML